MDEKKRKFYNAIAHTEAYVISLSSSRFQETMRLHEDTLEKSQLTFLRTIPEFLPLGNNVLKRLCKEFKPVSCIKGHTLYQEGKPAQHLYFVRDGGFKVQKLLAMGKDETPLSEEAGQMLENYKQQERSKRKTRFDTRYETHTLGIVQDGHILGLEEAVLSPPQQSHVNYHHSLVCLTMSASLYKLDRSSFIGKLVTQQGAWQSLIAKAMQQAQMFTKSATNMRNIPHKLRHGIKEAEEKEKRERAAQDGAQADKAFALKLLDSETDRNTQAEQKMAAGLSGSSTHCHHVDSLRDLIIKQSVQTHQHPMSPTADGRELDYSRLMTPDRGLPQDSAFSPSNRGTAQRRGVHLP